MRRRSIADCAHQTWMHAQTEGLVGGGGGGRTDGGEQCVEIHMRTEVTPSLEGGESGTASVGVGRYAGEGASRVPSMEWRAGASIKEVKSASSSPPRRAAGSLSMPRIYFVVFGLRVHHVMKPCDHVMNPRDHVMNPCDHVVNPRDHVVNPSPRNPRLAPDPKSCVRQGSDDEHDSDAPCSVQFSRRSFISRNSGAMGVSMDQSEDDDGAAISGWSHLASDEVNLTRPVNSPSRNSHPEIATPK